MYSNTYAVMEVEWTVGFFVVGSRVEEQTGKEAMPEQSKKWVSTFKHNIVDGFTKWEKCVHVSGSRIQQFHNKARVLSLNNVQFSAQCQL